MRKKIASFVLGRSRSWAALAVTAIALPSFGLLVPVASAGVATGPAWNLDIHHDETNFPPGGNAELTFDVRNVGETATTGPVTLTVNLPAGLTRESFRIDDDVTTVPAEKNWVCPGSPGDSTFTCTTNESFAPGDDARNLILTVAVAPGAGPDVVATATVSGGGAPDALCAGCRRLCVRGHPRQSRTRAFRRRRRLVARRLLQRR
jgi:uncharacterized repeat protein (TIGR01451 family)